MKEGPVYVDMMFVSNYQASERAKPGKCPLNFISPSVSVFHSAVLLPFVFPVFPVWGQQSDASLPEPFSQRITIVGFVSNNSLRPCSGTTFTWLMDPDLIQSLLGQSHLSRRGRVDMASQWNTLAIDHHHPLRSFAPLGFSDSRAPFFAGAKLPSIKASLQSRTPSAYSCERKVRQILSQTPCSSHSPSLLQQVDGLGYLSGKSFHLAPVRKTHSIPSTTIRSSARGRPLFPIASDFGSRGKIFSHCSSLNSSVRRLIGSPPMSLIREKDKKYKWLLYNSKISSNWYF